MSDHETNSIELDDAIAHWRQTLGASAKFHLHQDSTNYDQVDIRAGGRIARLVQEADGWRLYDLNGAVPVALTDMVRHPLALTASLKAFADLKA